MTAAKVVAARTEAVAVAEAAPAPLELWRASASFLLLASLLRLSSAFRRSSSLYCCRHLLKETSQISRILVSVKGESTNDVSTILEV